MKTSTAITSTFVTLILAVPLLGGCPKPGSKDADADATAEAGVVAVEAPPPASVAPSASAAPSADAKRTCKPGQTFVQVKGARGVESQCQQVCQQDRGCPLGQMCKGTTVVPGQIFCQNIRPTCKAGERLLQGSAATLFDCVKPCRADADCPKERPSCAPDLLEDADTPALKFRICSEPPSPAASKAPDIRPPSSALNASAAVAPTAPPPAVKLKCVLPSPPPCAAPHVKSPKGLCQLPCSNGSCAACGGTCQSGFCVGG